MTQTPPIWSEQVEAIIDVVMEAERYAPKIVPYGDTGPLFDGMHPDRDGPWVSRVDVAKRLRSTLTAASIPARRGAETEGWAIPSEVIDRYYRMMPRDIEAKCEPEPGTGTAHLKWMLDQLRTMSDTNKAMRWLGFIQGVLIGLRGYSTVTVERDFTRPFFAALPAPQPVEEQIEPVQKMHELVRRLRAEAVAISDTLSAPLLIEAAAAIEAFSPNLALESAETQVATLREIISRCAAALPNGAFMAPRASVEFMAELPHEIELVSDRLTKRVMRLTEALAEAEQALIAAEERDDKAGFRANSPRMDSEVIHLRTSAIRHARAALEPKP